MRQAENPSEICITVLPRGYRDDVSLVYEDFIGDVVGSLLHRVQELRLVLDVEDPNLRALHV